MEIARDRRVYSASDLVDFIACGYLLDRRRAIASGEIARPERGPEERLVAQKGDAHEAAYLASLARGGIAVEEISRGAGYAHARAAADATRSAMRAGAAVIHNATFVEVPIAGTGWVGVADFLQRVPGASALGDYHYEVYDAKLARATTPAAIVQMCFYGELVAAVQQRVPARMHAVLGTGEIESYDTADAAAYVRAVRARFLRAAASANVPYPDPVAHCARCAFSVACEARRHADDRLTLVAGLRRTHLVKLHAAGIATVAALAAAGDDRRPRTLERTTFARLRAQAALQVAARGDGVARYELLPQEEGRGFARLPAPAAGDCYFDMEGDPFYEGGGLEYLFGVAYDEAGATHYTSFVGHDRAAERRAFEAFVDFIVERRRRYPAAHVYHYAAYEVTALRRLALAHATREDVMDDFLREGVFVDLYDVVRQSLRASFESYSLKKIEQFYRGPRNEDVTNAIGSIVAYEAFLATRDCAEFDRIVAYNRDDCVSTLDLHRWLCARKSEAEARGDLPAIAWRVVASRDATAPASESTVENDDPQALVASDGEPGDSAAALVAHLGVYHRREAKPAWYAFFERIERKSAAELVDDAEALGELSPCDGAPELFKRSHLYTFTFPAQEHKLKPGRVYDPALGSKRSVGTLVAIDDDRGTVTLSRSTALEASALPRALCPPGPINDEAQRRALRRFTDAFASDACATRYRAAADLVRASAPRLRHPRPDGRIDDGAVTPEKLTATILNLDESYLFVQGPPGTGKTWTGARAIVALLDAGLRVGVASSSHKAIANLLDEIERVAARENVTFRGLKKASVSNLESRYASASGSIVSTTEVAACAGDPQARLIAGTAWLFADAAMDASVDVLVIDEAGQVALADAVAMATAARNVVLLGDPMQLAQVSQAQHPAGAGASVLAHLLRGASTVAPERGFFLARSFRMHDAVCAFVSQLAYAGRLFAHATCANRCVAAGDISGAGLRYLPVPHEGNVQSSVEEAEAIARAIAELLRGTVTDERGRTRALVARDVLVVTPYNAQVRRLRGILDGHGLRDVAVGTVDKFQGREAPVVFFSLAASRGEDVPRGVGFLFDRNRLNVAVSRAQVLAVLVAAPALLETAATSIAQLHAIDALCRFVERATPLRAPASVHPQQLALI